MSYPAFQEAGRDPAVTTKGSVASVYMYLTGCLDFMEFRRVKAKKVAREVKLRPETVGHALTTLRTGGYIERGPRVLDTFTYRLLYTRRLPDNSP